MAYTYTVHTGDGIKTVFDFQFAGDGYGYFRPSDVHVYVAQQEVGFTFVGTNQVQLTAAPPLGAVVMIRRIMPKDEPYAKWERGNNFNARNTNNSFLQQLYMVQELYDGFMTTGFRFNEDVSFGGFRVKDIANAIEDGDAVPLRQMKGWNDSALNSAIRAEAARDRAVIAETGSKASELAAAESARQARESRDSASADAVAASASAGAAVQAANTATGAATQAQDSAGIAASSATDSAVSAASSSASASTSEYWSKLSQAAALPDGSVNTQVLADGSVTTVKLASGAVTGSRIAPGTVGAVNLANNAVSQGKIQDAAVSAAKLAADAVTTTAILDAAVTEPKLADGAITNQKVADGSITKTKLAPDVADVYLPKSGGTVASLAVTANVSAATISATGNISAQGRNVVRSVNGVAADSNGDVNIPVGGGGVPTDSWGAVGCITLVFGDSVNGYGLGVTFGNPYYAKMKGGAQAATIESSGQRAGGTWRSLTLATSPAAMAQRIA